MLGLDRDAELVLRDLQTFLPDTHRDVRPEEMRRQFQAMIGRLRDGPDENLDGTIVDQLVNYAASSVPVRRYTPSVWAEGDPVILWCHGGGWVVGDINSAHNSAAALATSTRAQIVSVGYRLAPEHPFPAALHDCLAVLRAESSAQGTPNGIRPCWLGVGGDSAGGGLAAALALAAPAQGLTIDAVLMVYPAIDSSMRNTSHRRYAEGYLLTAQAMDYYWCAYAGGHRPIADSNPWLAPAFARDVSMFPHSVIATAGFDPLCDEGDAFAGRLLEQGVGVTHLRAEHLPHGWLDMTDRVPAALVERTRTFQALADVMPVKDVGVGDG